MSRLKITYNAPVILTFAIMAVATHVLSSSALLGEGFAAHFVARPHLHSAGDFIGLVSHILGHRSWDHLLGNFSMILLLGPIVEERFGSATLLLMILFTALATGLINALFLDTYLLGASGIAFMCILSASMANVRAKREIPLTFIAVAVLFLGGEVARSLHSDNISHMAHLVGGVAGAAFGFLGGRGSNRTQVPARRQHGRSELPKTSI